MKESNASCTTHNSAESIEEIICKRNKTFKFRSRIQAAAPAFECLTVTLA